MRQSRVPITLCLLACAAVAVAVLPKERGDEREQALRLMKQNNFAEAYTGFRKLVLDASNTDRDLPEDLRHAVDCLNRINRIKEFDALIEDAVETHGDNWRLLSRSAELLTRHGVSGMGFMIAGNFERGFHRGGGRQVFSGPRDRVRALQLLVRAVELIKEDKSAKGTDKANVYRLMADIIGQVRDDGAWKLQDLTNLNELPDYEEGGGFGRGGGFFSIPTQFGRGIPMGSNNGAPVDAEGRPVFHQLPDNWEAARSDGERWRWSLEMVARSDKGRRSEVDLEWAGFLQSQFGANSASAGPVPLVREEDEDNEDVFAQNGLIPVHKLEDTETIARLATGIRRFDLPDEFNHIVIFKKVIARNDDKKRQALESLTAVRMNRHQYPQAAALLEDILEITAAGPDREGVQKRIDQIRKNWIQFQNVSIQPAGTAATLDIRYRNGNNVRFSARPVNIEALLSATKDYLQSNPARVDYQMTQVENVGMQIIRSNEQKYLGKEAEAWSLKLSPPDDHFDALKTVTTPLKTAGAWYVTAKIKGGNEARMVIWIADTAITRKRTEQGTLHFVADAVTGTPVSRAELEFFGWRTERVARTRNYKVLTNRFADRTDADGLCVPEESQLDRSYRWLTIARTAEGRLAYDGFNSVWNPQKLQPLSYSPTRVYSITDRPVYRPGHELKYRMWVRQPQYTTDDARFANKAYALQIRNPKGDIVLDKDVRTDRWAGVDGEWTIPEDATLGQYSILIGTRATRQRNRMVNGQRQRFTEKYVQAIGSGSFKIEEYRKPEFEVAIDAPDKPVMLGEKIQAKVEARYYFGAPVTEAKVHYKVERTEKDTRWYPIAPWDWLYSPGYWWFAPDYEWYPGWKRWGCIGPIPPWRGWQADPPEIIAEGDAEIGADGTFMIDIDTASAKANHGDSDHNYSITAEVVDNSRRTIIGSGNVLVARSPYKVFVWTDRGHYRTGDTATIGIQARTAAGKPVNGDGTATLYSVTYPDGDTPVEKEVESWAIATAEDGRASQKMTLPRAGQYRVAVKLRDGEGHQQEGGYILFARGNDEDGRGYRFNDLELIADKQDYQPGETAKLQVSTNKADSTVLLFIRPMNGLCPAPKLIRMKGKSTTLDIPITREDMPNIFVEALTVSEGKIHTEIRELVVPPEKSVANVEVLPSAERYRPGEDAKVRLKLTDLDGEPFVGNTVLSVYDASLEAIAASSIPEIRRFFWNSRRRHNLYTQSTLQQQTGPLYKPREIIMQVLAGADPAMFRARDAAKIGGGGFFGGMPGAPAMARGRSQPMVMADGEANLVEGDEMAMEGAADLGLEGGPAAVEPSVRSNFADTAHWVASVTSDVDGIVEVTFKVPDNLTTWKVKAWALGEGTRVGSGTSEIISSKDLIVRPQTPRFFTETDIITLSAVVHNYLDSAKSTQVVLESEGGQLEILGDAEQVVKVEANGEVRVDWTVRVVASGEAKVRMLALTDEESDAAELKIPVKVHGILKTESFAGVIRPDSESATIKLNVPGERIEEQSRLEVRFSPTLAGAMVDALPYLIDYPYGCAEQTLNRFLPAAITQKTLVRMGIDLNEVRRKRTNLNAQELGDPTVRAAQWKRYERNPVFDTGEMNLIVRTGVQDLTSMQLSDGGWGWFSGYGERSTAHLTSQVVHGLTLARQNDVPILPGVIERGVAWLKKYQADELQKLKEGDWRRENPDKLKNRKRPSKNKADNMDAFVAFVLSEHDGSSPDMSAYLYRDRGSLSVYGKALTGLVLHAQQQTEQRDMLLRNIEQVLVKDNENQTAWLDIPQGWWWYWYGSDNEAMARYLQLLLKANPKGETAPMLVKYLLNNRKHGTYWKSTRDTALVIEAMADYLDATDEAKPNMTVEVLVDGRLQKKVKITADNLFGFDNVMLLKGDAVKSGAHTVELRRSGTGPLYFNTYLTNFTKEEQITSAGLEVKVQRNFFKLVRDDRDATVEGDRGQVVKQTTARYKRLPLKNLSGLKSGDLVEVELVVESKNDYEYLLLEDLKPSGFETDDKRSGYIFEGLRAYRELRDDRVSFFLSNLARGRHSVSYRIRAETPSQQVAALPAKIEGMYAPELVGNSDEIRFSVSD